MKPKIKKFFFSLIIMPLLTGVGFSQNINPNFHEKKTKNYLPHMTSAEFAKAVKTIDMAIIPVGSIEQHGNHLPLGTDFYAAREIAKLVAQQTEVIVAPALMVGLAKYHMGFPGTLSLKPETFEAVLYETALSLIHYGIKKIMIYNGHGGNNESVARVIRKINHTTPAVAVWMNKIETPKGSDAPDYTPLDMHAGVFETSLMLYLTPDLVVMSAAEKPKLSIPSEMEKVFELAQEDPNMLLLQPGYLFTPKKTGKKGSSKEITNTGAFTTGDPKKSKAEYGKKRMDVFVKAVVKFINNWKKIK